MRINRQAIYLLLCMSAFTLGGCKVKRPKDVIAEDKMENILYDYHLAKAMGDELQAEDNYKRQLYIDAVFRKYGVTEAEFDSSMIWYTRNTGKLDDIYENVTNRLKADAKGIDNLMAVREKRNSTSAEGDSVDVWAWRKVIPLTDSPMNNLFTFVLSADSNYKVNDRFVWEADLLMQKGRIDNSAAPVLSLQLVYDNDSTVGVTRHVMRAGRNIIDLGDDRIGRVKTINGFIYRPLSNKLKGDVVVGNISLMRYHTNDTIVVSAKDTAIVDSIAPADTIAIPVEELHGVEPSRLTPEEMNRRRTTIHKVERPEQVEVEKKIEKERQQLEKSNKNRKLPSSRKR